MTARGAYTPDGKSAAEIREHCNTIRDATPLTTRCALCDWEYDGTAFEGRELARGHRRVTHPEIVEKRRRRNNITRFNPSDDGFRDAGVARAAGVADIHRRREGEAA